MKCDLHRTRLPGRAYEASLTCPRCGGRIPASAAASPEGAEYVHNFCGPECLAQWCRRLHRHGH